MERMMTLPEIQQFLEKVGRIPKIEPFVEEVVENIPKRWGFYHTHFDIIPPKKIVELKPNAAVQTKSVWTSDQGTQMIVKSIETQTPGLFETIELTEYPDSLNEFFRKITPMICRELEDNVTLEQMTIFKEFIRSKPVPAPTVIVVKLEEPRKIFSFKNALAIECQRKSVAFSWSNSGVYMAASYTVSQHKNWCHHTSNLAFYNLNKLDPSLPFPEPEKELTELEYCLTSLAFNPLNGSILAAGKINGDVILIDFISMEGSSFRRNKYLCKGVCHSDRIVALQWITLTPSQIQLHQWKNQQHSNQFLVSASKDGYIGLWSTGRVTLSLYLEKRFALLIENIPTTIHLISEAYKIIREIAITSMSCSELNPTKIIFSTIGSFVFTGDIFSSRKIDKNNDVSNKFGELKSLSEVPIYDPDSSKITSQRGMIVAISCSPFHQCYVLSLAAEGHIVLQNILHPDLSTLEFYLDMEIRTSATDVKWSPYRPMMFAVTRGRELCIFDLLKDQANPSLTIRHENQLQSIEFSKGRIEDIAVVDIEGEVFVWELPYGISHRQPNELVQLIDLEEELNPSCCIILEDDEGEEVLT